MRCRQTIEYTDNIGNKHKAVVWFGKVIIGTTEHYCSNDIACSWDLAVQQYQLIGRYDNYVDKQNAVVSSLTQRLSVLRGELWYAINQGMPLVDKVVSKGIIDSYVVSTVTRHPDVLSIQQFSSSLIKHSYTCNFTVLTRFGELIVSV